MIYFVQDQGTCYIKIGFTEGDPTVRLKALQTACPCELILLCLADGEREEEARLHRKFVASRVHGEWFRPTANILIWMAGVHNFAGYLKGHQVGYDARGIEEEYHRADAAREGAES